MQIVSAIFQQPHNSDETVGARTLRLRCTSKSRDGALFEVGVLCCLKKNLRDRGYSSTPPSSVKSDGDLGTPTRTF